MLRWLKINRYRNVAPGTELTFAEGHHVLLGPNGGGKTTLLELIAAVLRGDFSAMAEEDFDLAYRTTRGSTTTIEVKIAHRLDDTSGGGPRQKWRSTLTATLRHGTLGTRTVVASDDRVVVDDGEPRQAEIQLTAPTLHTRLALLAWDDLTLEDFQPHFEWLGAIRFDEALAFFTFMRGLENLGSRAYVTVYRGLTGAPRVSWLRHPLFGGVCELMVEALRLSSTDTDRITLPITAMGSFGEVVGLLGFKEGALRAELERELRTQDQERLTYERFQFRFVRHDETMVLDEHLSFGQKRLLAFMFYAWSHDGPIVADELVDGMHHRWVEHCLETIRGRQAFLSSQNPLLMDFIGFDSAEAVQQTFVICDVEERDGREHMRWRNLSADEASEFFNAYEVGIQHVSEILRDKGLW